MDNDESSYLRARERAEQTADAQEKNRLWWETLPMTYAGWEEKDRVPKTREDYLVIERAFLDGNPWLKSEFDFGAYAGKDVLEIGSGSGVASCFFGKEGANVTGIHLTDQSLAIASHNAELQGVSGVRFLQMDAEKITLPDEAFDHAFSWGVLHHTSRPAEGVRHMGRVLRKGGTGLIMVYHTSSFRFWGYGLYWLLVKRKLFKGYNMQTVQGFATDGYYQRHYTRGQLKALLRSAGLEPTRVSVTHMSKKYVPVVGRGLDEWLKRRFGWLLVAEFRKP